MNYDDNRIKNMYFVPGGTQLSDEEYAKLLQFDWDERSEIDSTLYTCAFPAAPEKIIQATGKTDYSAYFNTHRTKRAMKKENFRVLEYGCGIGRMTEFIAKAVGHVTAVDISKNQLQGAQLRLLNQENIEFGLVNGLDLNNLRDNSYDYIFSYLVFQHVGSISVIESVMNEMVRVLKRRGVMKLQFRDKDIPENNSSGNTWHGARVSPEFVTKFAAKHRLEIMSMEGQETEYFWVEFKREK